MWWCKVTEWCVNKARYLTRPLPRYAPGITLLHQEVSNHRLLHVLTFGTKRTFPTNSCNYQWMNATQMIFRRVIDVSTNKSCISSLHGLFLLRLMIMCETCLILTNPFLPGEMENSRLFGKYLFTQQNP